jgi:hypothetical protein
MLGHTADLLSELLHEPPGLESMLLFVSFSRQKVGASKARQHGDTEIPQSSEITGKCKTLQTQQVASKKSGPQLSTHLSTCLYSHSKQNPAVWQEIV